MKNELEQLKVLRESVARIEEAKPKRAYLYAYGIVFSARARAGGRVNEPKLFKFPLDEVHDVLNGEYDITAGPIRAAEILSEILRDRHERQRIEAVINKPGSVVNLDDGETYDLNFSTDGNAAADSFERGQYASDYADSDGFDRSQMHR